MDKRRELAELVKPLSDDLTSGAAEIALRAISVFQTMIAGCERDNADVVRDLLRQTARALVNAQPAMAPVFHLGNSVLLATRDTKDGGQTIDACNEALARFEKRLCESAALIADQVIKLIPPGELIFAFSFSSTVVSSLLAARATGKFFRVVCTEARPSMEGRKLAGVLAAGGIEVIHTFDSAFGLILPNCRAAFMGCDCVGLPGIVNKVGSWSLAVACRELSVPLYALSGTEKFINDDHFFEFERHERPGHEVWPDPPKGVRVLNHQFEIVPFSLLSGLVTEQGVLQEEDIKVHVSSLEVHESMTLEGSTVG